MQHDKGPSRASRCPHKTITAFDIAPHNVGDSRALVDDRHQWIYCDERMQRRSRTQLGPSTCKGCDSPGDQPMGPVSRKEARSDDRKMRPRFGRRTKWAEDKDVARRANCFKTEGTFTDESIGSRIAARNSAAPSRCDHSTAIHRARSTWYHSACFQRSVIDVPAH